ncbi:TPA: PepSY domain-containing protein [Streptococcus agalactiae]
MTNYKNNFKKFMSNKLYVGLASITLLGIGGAIGVSGAALAHNHHSEHMSFEHKHEGHDKHHDHREKHSLKTLKNISTKIDYKTALETAKKEARSGFISQIELKTKGDTPFYEIKVIDNKIAKKYKIDANSGKILSTTSDNQLNSKDAQLKQPSKDIQTALQAIQAKYKNAKIKEISLANNKSNKLVYKVKLLDGNTPKIAQFDSDKSSFIKANKLNTTHKNHD